MLFRNYRQRQKNLFERIRHEEKRIALNAVVEAEENQRKRIAADLHDNMGAYASAIIANVDEVMDTRAADTQVLLSLRGNASEIMSSLRETIWALNNEKIALTGICDRFKNYLKKFSTAFPQVSVEIEEEIEEDIQFTAVQALHIFRILQEAVTNAVKHSNGNLVRVVFLSQQKFCITIEDNGTGIQEPYVNKGNGMANMKSRAKESGLNFKIDKKEKGTRITLTNFGVAQPISKQNI